MDLLTDPVRYTPKEDLARNPLGNVPGLFILVRPDTLSQQNSVRSLLFG